MPFLGTPSPSSGSSRGSDTDFDLSQRKFDFQHIVDDSSYALASNAECSEKPLSQQLEPIAVCGMGCRLPGDVKSTSDFWALLMNAKTGNTPKVPSDRFNINAHLHPNNDRPGSFNVPGGYFLTDNLEEFDPSFFNMTPIEGMWLDPQQRKLLEVTYEALESAGISLADVNGAKVGVFMASFTSDFQQMTFKESAFRHSFAATGTDPGIISNRISHVFNMTGPSMYVNTACSSSVYAVNNACNALRNGECIAAVVGGSNLILTADQHMNTAKLGVLSPTSTCHTFDASADGYGRAEGAGVVYLKRLSDAIKMGDPIRGVIRSSATNNNGKVPNLGITHPNREGQVEVIRHAYERGGDLDPKYTAFVEVHGTGTPVGDPIEVNAVSIAMTQERTFEQGPLLIGAVKPNIGHSEAASGLSAIIKAILAVERGMIPPTRGITKPNPAIDWKGWKVTTSSIPTPFPDLPVKRISLNSFGYGGTNAHVIVESADSLLALKQLYQYHDLDSGAARRPRGVIERKRPYLLPFSAHENAALQRNLLAHLKIFEHYKLHDISYTLSNRRSAFHSRGFTVVSHDALQSLHEQKLGAFTIGKTKKAPTVGFVFTGQGAQWPRMGSDLMAYYPSFLRTIRDLDVILGELEDAPEWTIEESLTDTTDDKFIHGAEFAQPLCTAVQIALVNLLLAWNVLPVVTVGHSSGEIAAAYAAGHISASEAILLAYYRGKLVKDINTNGAMCAVGLGAEEVQPFLSKSNGRVIVACHNSPSSVTLSGDAPAVGELYKDLTARNIFARMVKTTGKAYHSSHMAPAAAKYEAMVRQAKSDILPFDSPLLSSARMVSSVTNSVLNKDAVLEPSYFSANLRQPVLFNQALSTVLSSPEFTNVDILVEIGPHGALSSSVRQIKSTLGVSRLDYLPSLVRGEACATQMLKLAGELFNRGYPLDMDRISAVEKAEQSGKILHKRGNLIVDLPGYQWDNKVYWAENRQSAEHRRPVYPRHDLLGAIIPGSSLAEPTWRNVLRVRDVPWLAEHTLGGEAIYPCAAYFSMAMEAVTQIEEQSKNGRVITGYELRDVSIKQALVSPDDEDGTEVLFNMRPAMYNDASAESCWWDFHVSSVDREGTRKDHMSGTISASAADSKSTPRPTPNLPQMASGKEWNQALRSVGFDYGTTFADLDDISFDGKRYLCAATTKVKVDSGVVTGGESRAVIHPGSVDSCLQLMIAAIYAGRTKALKAGAVPIQVDQVSFRKPSAAQIRDGHATALAWIDERGFRNFNGGSQLVSYDGEVLMTIENMRCTSYEAAIPQRATDAPVPKPFGQMKWVKDSDFVTSSTPEEYVKLAMHKVPGLAVLDIGARHYEALLAKFPGLSYTACVEPGEAASELEAALLEHQMASFVSATFADGNSPVEDLSFDLALIPESNIDVNNVRRAVRSGGKIMLVGESRSALMPVNHCSPDDSKDRGSLSVQLVYPGEAPALLASTLTSLEELGYTVTATPLAEAAKTHAESVVMLDLADPILASLSKLDFEAIKSLVDTSSKLIWVTGGGLLTGQTPRASMAAGLARTIRAEQASKTIVTIDIGLDNNDMNKVCGFVAAKMDDLVRNRGSTEVEYCFSENCAYISRLLTSDEITERHFVDQRQVVEKALEPGMRISANIQSGRVVFQRSSSCEKRLQPDEVEIRVDFAPLTREGVAIINGSDYPTTFSHEIAGTIEALGESVKAFSIGDRVVAFSFDRLATYQVTRANLVRKLAAHESPEKVASLLMPYGAALHGLKDQADVKSSDTVIILDGTGHSGIAAIEISLLCGSTPYIALSSAADSLFLASRYGIPADHVLTSDQATIEYLKDSASSIDVVFSSGGSSDVVSREAWRHIGRFGRFIDSGRKNALRRNALDTTPFQRGATYHSFDMLDLYNHKPKIISELLSRTVSLYRDGKIGQSVNPTTRSISELDEAVAAFQDGFGSARTVIDYNTRGALRFNPSSPVASFDSNATYLLVGCLGGLGRSLSSWMLARGARHFCFLSRSGSKGRQASALVKDLQSSGAHVYVSQGDVSKLEDVQKAVDSIPASRPLRGVINAAMVLRDNLFHKMTYEDWITSISPKVLGSENLHKAVSNTPLDFFLMTSSVSGILGTPGQANYAAANSFMDALAQHRHQSSLKACSIVVPMVLGVGVVAANRALEDNLTRKGMYGIDEAHLLRAFEAAIIEQARAADPIHHLVLGLDPGLLQQAIEAAGPDCDPFWTRDARFRAVLHGMQSATRLSAAAQGGQGLVASLKAAASGAEARQVARASIESKIGRMLLLGTDSFADDEKSIAAYGIDSMIGAEFRNWVFKEFGADVPFQQLLGQAMTPGRLAELLCK